MVIFILIFFATIITVGAAAVFGFSFYLKRRTKSIEANNQKQFVSDSAPQYRSLFEPDDEEIRRLEREETAKIEAEKLEAARQISIENAEKIKELQTIFLENPTRKNTVELLLSAVSSERAKIFGDAAENVIQNFRENKIKNLTSIDLADLLDSHLRILSQQERASGAIFWLKQEIADLRRKSEENV